MIKKKAFGILLAVALCLTGIWIPRLKPAGMMSST